MCEAVLQEMNNLNALQFHGQWIYVYIETKYCMHGHNIKTPVQLFTLRQKEQFCNLSLTTSINLMCGYVSMSQWY